MQEEALKLIDSIYMALKGDKQSACWLKGKNVEKPSVIKPPYQQKLEKRIRKVYDKCGGICFLEKCDGNIRNNSKNRTLSLSVLQIVLYAFRLP